MQDTTNSYILQKFTKGQKVPFEYFESENTLQTMQAKLRITPYYSFKSGTLVSVKVTGCEKTDFIHATTSSINAPICCNESIVK